MSSSPRPPVGGKAPLVDDPSVKEVFVTNVIGVINIDSTLIVTFATTRLTGKDGEPCPTGVISARLAMPLLCAGALAKELSSAIQRRDLAATPTTNPI